MKTKIHSIKGSKIRRFRFSSTNLKLYLTDDMVLQIVSPLGLTFSHKKLQKCIGLKISKAVITKIEEIKLTFKNGKKLSINSTDFIEVTHRDLCK